MRSPLRSLTAVNRTMTSKTSSLKALLLRAWRERWSDLQWGIHIKTILPRGVCGDVYNLADCILQQALIGPGPNQLLLSYLQHTLSSQLVSYGAVLMRIKKYQDFDKPHCIISLLEFLQSMQQGITCRGKPEEAVLAKAVLSVTLWLLQCMNHALETAGRLSPSGAGQLTLAHPEMLDIPANILAGFTEDDFIMAMMYLAKHEDEDLHQEVLKRCRIIENFLRQQHDLEVPPSLSTSLGKLQSLNSQSNRISSMPSDDTSEPLTFSLQPLLVIELQLHPCQETQVYVNRLRVVQRLKGFSTPRLYCEAMRAGLLIVNNVLDKSQVSWCQATSSLWVVFTFIRLPQILLQLHVSSKGILEKNDYSPDVVDALEMLLQFTALLDVIDTKWPSNCLLYLMTALRKVGLIQDSHVQSFKTKREATMAAPLKLEQSSPSALPPSNVLQQAEPLLARILMTLEQVYEEPEPLLKVLYPVLSGKNFELILAVATVEGTLRTFVSRLIKLNESSKDLGESGKNAHTRAMLFDITFLMLCLIVQTYGSDVVLSDQNGKSFFELWVRDCLVERGRPKSPEQIVKHYDAERVTKLLSQLNSNETEFSSHVKWHEVCLSVPAAIKEVLLAWEHEALSPNDVKRILNALGSKMCCLPACAATWLCSYMQILHQDALLKPMNMVQQLLSKPTAEAGSQEFFTERSELMAEIICKMQQDVPVAQPKGKSTAMSNSIISKQPISEQLSSIWSGIQQDGWLHHESAQALESLLPTAGCNWFVTNVVKEVLKFSFQEELARAVDLAFAVFHLDIESCTLALLSQVLPKYLQNRLLNDELIEPQGIALAQLCAYCIFAASQLEGSDHPGTVKSRKRPHRDDEDGDIGRSTKMLRLDALVGDSGDSTAAPSLVFNAALSSKHSGSANGMNAIGEPLATALRDLFAVMNILVTRDGEISLQTHFVFWFLDLIVSSGKEHAPIVLQDMPSTLVPSLIRALPEMFSTKLLLGLYDIHTTNGRKDAARDLCLLRNLRLRSQHVK